MKQQTAKSLKSWIWDAACSIRGAKNAPKYKGYILPFIFTKRLCDVFDGELNRIADTLFGWKEEEKHGRIVDHAELKKIDFNISPNRDIHTSDAETYRPIAKIVDDLDVVAAKTRQTDKALREILGKIGV